MIPTHSSAACKKLLRTQKHEPPLPPPPNVKVGDKMSVKNSISKECLEYKHIPVEPKESYGNLNYTQDSLWFC